MKYLTLALIMLSIGCGRLEDRSNFLPLPPSSCVTMNTRIRASTCYDDKATCDKLMTCCSKPGTSEDNGCMMFLWN